MPFAIPFASEVVLVFSPRNPRHEMRGISPLAPGLHPLFKRFSFPFIGGISTNTVNHGNICPCIGYWLPVLRGLKTGFFPGSCFPAVVRLLADTRGNDQQTK